MFFFNQFFSDKKLQVIIIVELNPPRCSRPRNFRNPIFAPKFYNIRNMSVWRVILSVLFPPLAVYDRGCGSIIIVILLTLLGWIPGVLAALIILNNPNR